MEHIWTMLMHKILQNHLLSAFVANLKIYAIYALYPESFCDKNLAIRKVFAFCDSVRDISSTQNHMYLQLQFEAQKKATNCSARQRAISLGCTMLIRFMHPVPHLKKNLEEKCL